LKNFGFSEKVTIFVLTNPNVNVMLNQEDIKQISAKGISVDQVNHQLDELKNGFPFLHLDSAAAVGKGILAPSPEEIETYSQAWEDYKQKGHRIVKFVPASGAASRMFKNIFAFLNADYDVPTTDFEKTFFTDIRNFAFFDALDKVCRDKEGKGVLELIDSKAYKTVVSYLLEAKGLDYGELPKGLLLFHRYKDGTRTPMEEHLVEAALYASSNGRAYVHFTVSHDHLPLFKKKVAEKAGQYEAKFGIKYDISFSEQKPSTDTIAANPDGTPFRNADGTLLFRPGGHGALIENLNEINADVIFIKNIDNVVQDRLKPETVKWKGVLAGLLVTLQKKIFGYMKVLDEGEYNHAQLEDIIHFLQRELCCRKPDIKELEDAELVIYLKEKLHRPIRVCGVVKNVGEPGGGPFLAYNQDGTVSPQILESSQINQKDPAAVEMFRHGTHFNPVDLVCATKDSEGKAYHLPDYVDRTTGFVSNKSKNGRDLKALELPGLWNGAMSDWNTVFVEVPLITFNPVKTVNDLLKEPHQ
jgi:hypothetical protein